MEGWLLVTAVTTEPVASRFVSNAGKRGQLKVFWPLLMVKVVPELVKLAPGEVAKVQWRIIAIQPATRTDFVCIEVNEQFDRL